MVIVGWPYVYEHISMTSFWLPYIGSKYEFISNHKQMAKSDKKIKVGSQAVLVKFFTYFNVES